jgi:hypothetical protein
VVPDKLTILKKKLNQSKEYTGWFFSDRNGPPPHSVKQKVLKDLAEMYELSFFVETGTHSGATVNAMRGQFEKIYSIELSDKFYQSAQNWFKNDKSVSIIHGDSGVELEGVVKQLTGPALFWLDGHYSAGATARGEKDTPIIEELGHIYAETKFKHVVVIDDARAFGTDPAYPTIQQINALLKSKGLKFDLSVKYDAIRILPI